MGEEMRRMITAALIGMMALPAAASAQDYDPWAGYEVRDIRQLRDEASARRERLRELAREQHAARNGQDDAILNAISKAIHDRPAADVLSGQEPPHPAPATEEVRESVAQVAVDGRRPVAKPKPAWRGPGLAGTPEDRSALTQRFAAGHFHIGPMPRYGATMTKDGFLMANQGLRAEVSVSQQRMRLMEGGRVIAEWPVSTGKRGYESTRGEFGVSFLSRNHRSRKYNNAPMPCSVFYNGGEAIHGTDATHLLGSKASRGCVRLETKNACALYEMVAQRGNQSLRVVVSE